MGDQFVALMTDRTQRPDTHRHVGIVVDDRAAVLARAREAGFDVRGNDVRDPWGNLLQVVDYREVQFTKSAEILRGMGLDGLEKTETALTELRAKGLSRS
jgi:hypothetical protein